MSKRSGWWKTCFFAVKFHIAHVFEVQGKVKGAKERYELLLRDKTIDTSLRADIFRQLGKSSFSSKISLLPTALFSRLAVPLPWHTGREESPHTSSNTLPSESHRGRPFLRSNIILARTLLCQHWKSPRCFHCVQKLGWKVRGQRWYMVLDRVRKSGSSPDGCKQPLSECFISSRVSLWMRCKPTYVLCNWTSVTLQPGLTWGSSTRAADRLEMLTRAIWIPTGDYRIAPPRKSISQARPRESLSLPWVWTQISPRESIFYSRS